MDRSLARLNTSLTPAEQEGLQKELEAQINYLIAHRFEVLVQALYRLDVDERRLKSLLQQHPSTDAARIIAALVIERQLQKLRTREQFRANPDIPEEDKW